MKFFRILYKTIGFLIHSVISGLMTLISSILVSPFMNKRKVTAYIGKFWSKGLIIIFGIKVKVKGDIKGKGVFLISNHQSYLDIIILYSKFPIIFVSKHDVKTWPVIGLLAMLAGTIFIDRRKTSSAKKYIRQIVKVLKMDVNIIIFPEGTSTDGTEILPFKTPLFQAVMETDSNVLPMYTKYAQINGKKPDRKLLDKVCWYGDMSFVSHLFKFLTLKSFKVEITLGEVIQCPKDVDKREARKILANQTRDAVINLMKNA